MTELIKVIILGMIEGVTEFLPISSTGHLLVFSALLDSQVASRLSGTFEIFIQIGAVIAVIAYYRKALIHQITSIQSDVKTRELWLAVFVAGVPAGIVGILFHDFIKTTLYSRETAPMVVALALISGGVAFIWIERSKSYQSTKPDCLSNITLRQAILIGLAQIVALIPGISRSGATILSAILAGATRTVATEFSFYLAIPILGGATILDLLFNLNEIAVKDLGYLLIGSLVSAVVAWIAIDWLLGYISSNSFIVFGYYRVIAGAGILILITLGVV